MESPNVSQPSYDIRRMEMGKKEDLEGKSKAFNMIVDKWIMLVPKKQVKVVVSKKSSPPSPLNELMEERNNEKSPMDVDGKPSGEEKEELIRDTLSIVNIEEKQLAEVKVKPPSRNRPHVA
ncbi:hypothetical protein ACLOJK_041421 [Asimina triloba]